MALVIFIACASAILLPAAHAQDTKKSLYYNSPGGENGRAGLYGGYINPDEMGKAKDLQQDFIRKVQLSDRSSLIGLGVKGMSYESSSNEVLLDLSTSSRSTLVKGSLCQKDPSRYYDNVSVIMNSAFSTEEARLGPYAIWNSDIFFVACRFPQGEYDYDNYRYTTTLRMSIFKMTGCQYPFTRSNPIDLDYCAEEIALILNSDKKVFPSICHYQGASDTLRVLESGNTLHFLLQIKGNTIFDKDDDTYYMNLYLAEQYETSKPASLLHSQPLPYVWNRWSIDSLGGIDYEDGVLCWTAIDRIFCSRWTPGQKSLAGIRQVLSPGMAARVCTAPRRAPEIANVTTGIAIVSLKENDWLSLYFGCFSTLSNHGGAGFLTLDGDWSVNSLYPLEDEKGKVLAGNMFLAKVCEN